MKMATPNGRGGPALVLNRAEVRRADTQVGPYTRPTIGNKKWLGLSIVALVLVVGEPTIQAQQAENISRVGVLVSATPTAAARRVKAFQLGLRELGYIEGKNIVLEYRYAEGRPEVLPERVNDLIRIRADIIVTDTSNAIQAAKNATKTIPVVFTVAIDPVGDGQVSSLARPSGNLTGLSILAPELNGKRLELLKEAFPKIKRVAFFTRSGPPVGKQRFNDAEAAARRLGLQLQFFGAKGIDDLENAFDTLKRAGMNAVLTNPSTFLVTNRALIIDLAAKHKLPVIYPGTEYPEGGGLMSYGPDLNDNWHRAATYVDKILKGTKPGDLPVQQPMKFEFVINLKAAKQIGVILPPNLLARADRVIR
jgi:putative ABC transport system substrate-binding protein